MKEWTGPNQTWPEWVDKLLSISHLLLGINASMNILLYCFCDKHCWVITQKTLRSLFVWPFTMRKELARLDSQRLRSSRADRGTGGRTSVISNTVAVGGGGHHQGKLASFSLAGATESPSSQSPLAQQRLPSPSAAVARAARESSAVGQLAKYCSEVATLNHMFNPEQQTNESTTTAMTAISLEMVAAEVDGGANRKYMQRDDSDSDYVLANSMVTPSGLLVTDL